jgi:hypothetical protein
LLIALFDRGKFSELRIDFGQKCFHPLGQLFKADMEFRISTMSAIEKALSKAGIEFLPAEAKGEGVRLKNPKL